MKFFYQQIVFQFFIDLHSRSSDNIQGNDELNNVKDKNFSEKSFEEDTTSTENAKSEIEAMLKRRKFKVRKNFLFINLIVSL